MVGATNRVGWFMEPNCQSCHTGTATHNSGQIRYTSAFDSNGSPRVPADMTFATTPNTPAGGLSLYRFAHGHGGLQCSACHGSTHAIFPSTHANDNVRNIEIQGHAGVMVECASCHDSTPADYAGGPHGMHPVGQTWVSAHPDYTESHGSTPCQACHGTDYRGTVLSRMQADRTLNAFGTKTLFRGAIIGCYTCHNGPHSESGNTNAPPMVNVVSGNTLNSQPLNLPVTVVPASATLRIILQPGNGSLGVTNHSLTYFPNSGFVGRDTFAYAAYDGSKNSVLTTGTVAVAEGPATISLKALAPADAPAGWPAAFSAIATPVNSVLPASYQWSFGDGTGADTNQYAQHTFTAAGTYSWQVVASIDAVRATNSGSIVIAEPVALAITPVENVNVSLLMLSWLTSAKDVVVEESAALGASAQWTVVTNVPVMGPDNVSVNIPIQNGTRFFRLRQPW
jgi:PKD repeat protein